MAMGAAVVKGDPEEMRRLAPEIDFNAVAQPRTLPGMTLMRLAAENAFRKDSDKSAPEDLAVIKILLALGAKPNPGSTPPCASKTRRSSACCWKDEPIRI